MYKWSMILMAINTYFPGKKLCVDLIVPYNMGVANKRPKTIAKIGSMTYIFHRL